MSRVTGGLAPEEELDEFYDDRSVSYNQSIYHVWLFLLDEDAVEIFLGCYNVNLYHI